MRRVRHIALDMDGTIYCGDELFAETQPFLHNLQAHGITFSFLTNNSSKSVHDYVRHLAHFGIDVAPSALFTSTHATVALIQNRHPEIRTVLAVGTRSLQQELQSAGFKVLCEEDSEEPQAVIVGFDPKLNFSALCKATYWIGHGLPYFATHPDRVCPTNLPTVLLDCGALCAAIEAATGRKPDAIGGKPEPEMLHALCRRLQLQADEVAMIGDRLYTDVLMANRAGALSVLTLTGETQRRDLEGAPSAPDLVIENLSQLSQLLASAAEQRIS
ncbi:MAG: hypothetical protein JWN98_1830 [Abditibacteriota bacterium]|nr:hypothetical protein [Abditibacteriota bacterium]